MASYELSAPLVGTRCMLKQTESISNYDRDDSFSSDDSGICASTGANEPDSFVSVTVQKLLSKNHAHSCSVVALVQVDEASADLHLPSPLVAKFYAPRHTVTPAASNFRINDFDFDSDSDSDSDSDIRYSDDDPMNSTAFLDAMPDPDTMYQAENDAYMKLKPIWGFGVPRFFGSFATCTDEVLVHVNLLEYIPGNNLSHTGPCNIPFEKGKAMVRQALTLISRINKYGVQHGNPDPENWILGHDGKLSLIDFSLAKFRCDYEDRWAWIVNGQLGTTEAVVREAFQLPKLRKMLPLHMQALPLTDEGAIDFPKSGPLLERLNDLIWEPWLV